jgi:exodeoxyribonuclease-3
VRNSGPGAVGLQEDDFDPSDEARMLAFRVTAPGGTPIRLVSLYAPNGRVVGSPFYAGKLRWFERVRRWLDETQSPAEALLIGGDLNVAPADLDVWDPRAAHGGTHVSEPERARSGRCWTGASTTRSASASAPRGRFTWWDYRAGNFHKNFGMRIDHLLADDRVAARSSRRDRSGGAQGQAHPVRPRAARPRPRRAGQAIRPGLGRRGRRESSLAAGSAG